MGGKDMSETKEYGDHIGAHHILQDAMQQMIKEGWEVEGMGLSIGYHMKGADSCTSFFTIGSTATILGLMELLKGDLLDARKEVNK
jgi:hypothetical protein